MSEQWKTIAHTNGVYQVCQNGFIRRLKTPLGKPSGRILKPNYTGNVSLFVDLVPRSVCVGRTVAVAFIGPCPKGCVLGRKDRDVMNSNVENLEWITWSKLHARHRPAVTIKLSQATVESIRAARKAGDTYQVIADVHGTSRQHAWNICNGKCRSVNWDEENPG